MIYRKLRPDETDLLRDFVYEAIFVPEGAAPPPRDIIFRPELAVYYEHFGTGPADVCIVAEADGCVIGAAWARIMVDYGHVDDHTPSIAIALRREYRGQGTGTQLLSRLLMEISRMGYRQASLSVQKANAAVHLYERAGFRTVREDEAEQIMVCSFS
ncbi:MAG: GNAT family N-acetyltransferase [Clostridia bacterium]|nr:GNAT family N-acetyltransferase [Clostridia bacterium]